jgi:uncharacterized membrane protein YkoI
MKKLLAVLAIASLLTLSACVSKQITMEEAKEIALNDAGVDAASATFTTEKQEDRDYEFEFTANGTFYSYEITAGGKIESKEKTTTQNQQSTTSESSQSTDNSQSNSSDSSSSVSSQDNTQTSSQQTTSGDIGQDKALEIAYQKAGVSAADAQRVTAKLDRDDGRLVYEIEFFVGTTEYDFEIAADTGDILKYEHETR